MGNFAQQSLPLSDSVTLEVKRIGQGGTDTITVKFFFLLPRSHTYPSSTLLVATLPCANWRGHSKLY